MKFKNSQEDFKKNLFCKKIYLCHNIYWNLLWYID